MAESNFPYHFRAALNGFNREDVVAYIESSTREYEAQILTLNNEIRSLNTKLDEAQQELEQARDREILHQDSEELQDRISELEKENRALQDQILELKSQDDAAGVSNHEDSYTAQQDLSAPILPVGEVLPVDLAPSKDFSELELAAYRRAEMTERLARDRAQDVYRQVQSVFQNSGAKLDSRKSDLEIITKSIQTDVNQLMTLLSSIHSAYDDAEQAFEEVKYHNGLTDDDDTND
jgi:predicted  nucleic acid-binding Zn-ribbon protein